MTVTRPIMRYHGGKFRLAPWIISHFPAHRVYVEPFGGAASVLLRKKRSYAEIYNDLDGEVVNLFRVARDRGDELIRACEMTPFARDEFVETWKPANDPLEQARRTIARSFMGFGSAAATEARENGRVMTGFRANSNRSGTTPAHDWRNYPATLASVIDRLRGVVIENRDAVDCMKQHDAPEALHYVDPPYVSGTRDAGDDYRHEMTDEDHTRLATALGELEGMVIVSGYRCDLYDDIFRGWHRIDRAAHADGARARVESLWLSPNIEHRDLLRGIA